MTCFENVGPYFPVATGLRSVFFLPLRGQARIFMNTVPSIVVDSFEMMPADDDAVVEPLIEVLPDLLEPASDMV